VIPSDPKIGTETQFLCWELVNITLSLDSEELGLKPGSTSWGLCLRNQIVPLKEKWMVGQWTLKSHPCRSWPPIWPGWC
jgi:hypothetical protein